MKVSAKKINKINADIYFANKVFFLFGKQTTGGLHSIIFLNDLKAL